ncbi:MAG: DUF445 family protein [Bacillota bacterium]
MSLSFWLMPVVGGVIGWLTNLIAVRMLFRPKRPVRIPLLGVTIHGLLPSRHADIAASVGQALAEEILSIGEILKRVDMAGLRGELVQAVSRHVEERLEGGLGRYLPAQWRTALVLYLRDLINREADALIDAVIHRVHSRIEERVDIGALVAEKILALNLDELEELAVRLAGRELRAIVFLGGLLGFLIGLGQMGVTFLLLRAESAG